MDDFVNDVVDDVVVVLVNLAVGLEVEVSIVSFGTSVELVSKQSGRVL